MHNWSSLKNSWIQGQSASSLLFVALDETPLEPGVVERVDGKRAWRRHMSRHVRVTSTSDENERDVAFLANCYQFNVPEPTPEGDLDTVKIICSICFKTT